MTAPDRVALVTGAARGIGAATVRRLAAQGYGVIATDWCAGPGAAPYAMPDRADLDAVAEHPAVIGLVVDVRDRDALDAAVREALERWGRLDVAVAAAAVIDGGQPLWSTPGEVLDLLWDVDVRGVWNTAAATVPAMLAGPDPSGCRFVALASAAAHHGLHHLGRVQHRQTRCRRPRPRPGRRPGRHRRHRRRGLTRLHPHRDARTHRRALPRHRHRRPCRAPAAAPCPGPRRDRRDHRLLQQPRSRRAQRQHRPRRRRLLMTAATRTQQGTTGRLPTGFRVRLRDDVEDYDHGRILVGGSPLRALRLSDAARALIRDRTVEVCSPAGHTLATRLLDTNVADPVLDGIQVDPDQLTVIIPVHNRPTQLERALAALTPLHCVVVDDASTDPAAISAVTARHGARLIRLSDNVGPAGARNAGLRHVHTDLVAFVDSDIQVTAQVLLDLARHFTDRQVGLVGPLVRSRSRTSTPRWFERYDQRSSSLALGERACQVAPGAHVGWLPSACLVARRTALGTGFDPTLRVGEDVDLVWRLADENVAVRYDPSGVALHDARPTIGEWLGRKYVYGTGGAVLAGRHGNRTAVAALPPAMALAAAALLQRRRWSLPAAALCTAHAARRLHANLPDGNGRDSLSARLAARGLGWALRQEAALLLRHWAPPVLLGALVSRPLRRAVATALIIDTAIGLPALARLSAREALTDLIGRRLDDLAYGTGLWAGLLQTRPRTRAWHCVGVRIHRRQR